ncbi:capsular biosynthesis protein CpsH [Halobacteriales archaeon QS_9_70_65]|nr:MAG: capsular biosynthesis protein CpsH [Halobacteriales archaeon QS_9_70_65]
MTSLPATAAPFVSVPLQESASQADLFEYILGDTLLASSLYVNIALAGVSLASYTGLVSGLTVSILEMPAGHPAVDGSYVTVGGQEGVVSLWGRYLTWALSTPAILLALGLLAGSNVTKLLTAIVFDIAMCVTGLTAALTTSSLALRWFWFLMSCAFFVVVLYILLVEWPDDAAAAGTAEVFETLKYLTAFMWLGYPIVWALGVEGLALLPVGVTSWAYSALDIVAKYLFGFLVVRYVADEPRGVVAGGDEPR